MTNIHDEAERVKTACIVALDKLLVAYDELLANKFGFRPDIAALKIQQLEKQLDAMIVERNRILDKQCACGKVHYCRPQINKKEVNQ